MRFTNFLVCCLMAGISSSGASILASRVRYNPAILAECPATGEVYVPHEDCTKFLHCTNGFGTEQTCPDNLFWNPKTTLCDHPANVPECIGGTRPPPVTEPPTTSIPSTTPPRTTEEPRTTEVPITTTERTTTEPTTTTTVKPTTTTTTQEPTTTKPEYLIYSQNVTNWGVWDEEVSRCPAGTYAQGFQIKSETWVGPLIDDSSMNGIRLFCGDPLDETVTSVSSLEGAWGKWRNLYRCSNNGYVTGFQLKAEKPGIDLDETATNNIRILCSENVDPIEGDGETWGSWGEVQQCEGPQEAVCGIKTQVQPDRGALLDDTALNNVAFLCCSL